MHGQIQLSTSIHVKLCSVQHAQDGRAGKGLTATLRTFRIYQSEKKLYTLFHFSLKQSVAFLHLAWLSHVTYHIIIISVNTKAVSGTSTLHKGMSCFLFVFLSFTKVLLTRIVHKNCLGTLLECRLSSVVLGQAKALPFGPTKCKVMLMLLV